MIRPSAIAGLLFALGVPIALFVVIVDQTLWSFALSYPAFMALLVLVDGSRLAAQGNPETRVDGPSLFYVGESEQATLFVRGRTGVPLTGAEALCDVGEHLDPPPLAKLEFDEAGIGRAQIELRPRRRGVGEVRRIWLRWRGPMGLAQRQREIPVDAQIPIIPNIRAVKDAAIRFTARDSLIGIKSERQQGEGSEFEALREYVPGLDHRSIDWKHSARHRKLVCKEFRAERNHNIILAFDTGHLMSEPLDGVPKLDHAVTAGLILAYTSLRGGDRIGLFGFDSEVQVAMDPVMGMHNFWRVQHAAAELAYSSEETNYTLGLANLVSRLKRRSLIILITDFVDTVTAELMIENLGRLATRHLVLFVTLSDPGVERLVDAAPQSLDDIARTVIAHDFLRDRRVVMERLARLGAHCLEAPREQIGVALVNRYLTIKRLELI